MEFEWDDAKASANDRKHGVSFEEASTVFDDPKVVIFYDAAHSTDEERWIALGMSNRGRLLVVSHTYRGGAIRIISARNATKAEARHYG